MGTATGYEIRVKEELDEKWTAYFAPLKMVSDAHGTTLTGPVHDQAELFGVLIKIRDSGLQLVSVIPLN